MTAVDSEQEAEASKPASGGAGPAASPPGTPAGPAAAAKPPPPPPAAAAPGPPRDQQLADGITQALGIGVTLLALLVLGFAGYLYFLSGVQEARTQTTMHATLRGQMEQGIAPINAIPTGTELAAKPGIPIAILNIPAIGLRNEVVVQGTSPENLTSGPGHLRDTPMPGEGGVSVLYGRRATFGGPFARVPRLQPGDTIKVSTGQGTSTYRVKLVGDSRGRILINPAPNQLMLLTADSAVFPAHYIEVDANLVSPPLANAPTAPVSSSEVALGTDPNVLLMCLAWGMALLAVAVAGTYAATRWARWPAYLVIVPIALAVVWNLYQNFAALLPNLY